MPKTPNNSTNNRSNQMNPNNAAYFQSHGVGTTQPVVTKPDFSHPNYQSHVPLSGNNRANQYNPNNTNYTTKPSK